jgi:SH3 domain-binding glutamic acid-rich protein
MNPLADIPVPFKTTTSEEAVEYGELVTFLRLNETWDESIEETRPTLPAKPIGVPGASSPSQMAKPAHRALFDASPGASPLQRGVALASASPANKESLRKRNETEFDVGDELSGYGLQGVKVTDDELLALVEELGLGGDEAGDLVKGLSDSTDKADKGSGSSIGGSEQVPSSTESEAEPKPELAVPVTQEEVKASKGDDTREAETEVADAART